MIRCFVFCWLWFGRNYRSSIY